MHIRKILAVVILLMLAVSVSSCGRKGDPLRPSDVELTDEQKKAGVKPPEKKPNAPDRPFVLDSLLQ